MDETEIRRLCAIAVGIASTDEVSLSEMGYNPCENREQALELAEILDIGVIPIIVSGKRGIWCAGAYVGGDKIIAEAKAVELPYAISLCAAFVVRSGLRVAGKVSYG